MHKIASVILLFILTLSGCFSPPELVKLKQEDLVGHGVLTGMFVSNGWVADTGDIEINGRKYKDAIKNGRILVKLPPGKYTLEKVSFNNYAMLGFSTINRNFEIKPGHVTNIGRAFAYYKNISDKKYMMFYVKNSAETKNWFRVNQPAIYPQLAQRELTYPEGRYISGNDLNNLRKMIAKQEVEKRPDKSMKIISGQLGTLGRIIRNKKNQIVDIRIIPTDTLDDIKFCSENKARFACVVPDADLVYVMSGLNSGKSRVYRKKTSVKSNNINIVISNDNSITLIDDSINLYTSTDNGKTFTLDNRFRVTEPLEYFNHLEIHQENSGNYITVFSHAYKNRRMLYDSNRNSSGFILIPLPENNNPRDLYEAKNHLVMGPYPGTMSSSEIYQKALDSNDWRTVSLPSAGCYKLFVMNRKKDHLKIRCGTGKSSYYLSTDGGLKWKSM